MSATTQLELVIWYYIRAQYEKLTQTNLPTALKHLIASFSEAVMGSKLLTLKEDADFVQLLARASNIKRFSLLFRASEDGFKAKDFHDKCDKNGSTVTIIQSDSGNIFGGYTTIPWSSWSHEYKPPKSTDETFLFLIRSDNEINQKDCPLIFPTEDRCFQYNVVHDEGKGPAFGGGEDICISDNCNDIPKIDTVSMGLRSSYNYGSLDGPLCGGNFKDKCRRFYFQVLDYEVFQTYQA
eukprot:181385_1